MTFPIVQDVVGYQSGPLGTGGRLATHNVTIPSTRVSGELLLAFPVAEGAILNSQTPTGWTQVLTFTWNPSGTTYRRSVFARIASGTSDDNLSITTTNGGPDGRLVCVVYRISGWQGNLSEGIKFEYSTSTLTFPELDTAGSAKSILWLPVLMGLRPEAYGGASNGDSQITLASNYSTKFERAINNNWNGTLSGTGYPVVITSRRALNASAEQPGAYGNFEDATTAAVTATPITVAILPEDVGFIGIRIEDIKEPNQPNQLVTGVENARVKVWYGADDSGEEDDLYVDQAITDGTLEMGLISGSLEDEVIVEVMWVVGGERRLFITKTTVIDLEAES